MNEQDLQRYTDLTSGQFADLQDAENGVLTGMNGARHFAMREMIDDELQATEYGLQILKRGRLVAQGCVPPPVGNGHIENTSRAALYLRRRVMYHWVRSVHLKALDLLYQHPGHSYRWMCSVYGFEVVRELAERGCAEGELKTGAAFNLTDEGLALVLAAMMV